MWEMIAGAHIKSRVGHAKAGLTGRTSSDDRNRFRAGGRRVNAFGDIAQVRAGTPTSCGRLLLPALVLAAERIAASDPPRPAVGEEEGRRVDGFASCFRLAAGIGEATSPASGSGGERQSRRKCPSATKRQRRSAEPFLWR
jgi:hypothetical protein